MTSAVVGAEAVHLELEAKLQTNPDDEATWSAYAAWLTARGDPRGELMSLNAARPLDAGEAKGRVQELIAQVRARGLAGAQVECLSWLHGFPERLAVAYRSKPPPDVAALLALPELRFLRELTVGPGFPPHLGGLSRLPLLRRLGVPLQYAEAFASLPRARPPALSELTLTLSWPLELPVLEALAALPWLRELDKICIASLTVDDLELLLHRSTLIEPGGPELVLELTEEARVVLEPTLRVRNADVKLQVALPRYVDRFIHEVSPTPIRAPKHFRSLPPFKQLSRTDSCQDGCCYGHTSAGSGQPLTHPGFKYWRGPRRCMACGSAETFAIYRSYGQRYYRRDCEAACGEELEYECRACGKFTHASVDWTSG